MRKNLKQVLTWTALGLLSIIMLTLILPPIAQLVPANILLGVWNGTSAEFSFSVPNNTHSIVLAHKTQSFEEFGPILVSVSDAQGQKLGEYEFTQQKDIHKTNWHENKNSISLPIKRVVDIGNLYGTTVIVNLKTQSEVKSIDVYIHYMKKSVVFPPWSR